MSKLSVSMAAIFLFLSQLSSSHAQGRARISPHDTTKATIDGVEISDRLWAALYQGSENRREAQDLGRSRSVREGLAPWGGRSHGVNDEGTTRARRQSIPAGSYTLFMLPHNEKSATLIVNKQVGQWGTKYDEKQDFARVDMKGEPRVHQPINSPSLSIVIRAAAAR